MKHLITADEWAGLARVASLHVDKDEVDRYIEECEDMFIVPAIGVEVFDKLLVDDVSDELAILRDGGTYEDCGKTCRTKGLKVALAYYTYAKIARNDGFVVSRSGFMQHTDEYGQRPSDASKADRYNDIMTIAETYLSGCLSYLKTLQPCVGRVRGKRTTIKAIGD